FPFQAEPEPGRHLEKPRGAAPGLGAGAGRRPRSGLDDHVRLGRDRLPPGRLGGARGLRPPEALRRLLQRMDPRSGAAGGRGGGRLLNLILLRRLKTGTGGGSGGPDSGLPGPSGGNQNMQLRLVFAIVCLSAFPGCASTPGEPSTADRDIDYRGSDCILIATIRDYRTLDDRNLLIYGPANRAYFVTLFRPSF